ncbi:hypothetical protein [Pandoraea pulmonicola]|uniref:hypothetical protein n=1 Tax=Pandoraea pulmonicola TaxID=93221 RepID=UPI000E0F93ED|nr:hypothetical protein [Pandoraea pulmonicola]
MNAFLYFLQQPPSPGTSQQLDRFETIQKNFEQHLETPMLIPEGVLMYMHGAPEQRANVGASVGALPGPDQRPSSLATPDLLALGLFSPTPHANIEALIDGPSGSVQQPPLHGGARAGQKRAAPPHADGGGEADLPPARKISRRRISVETLRALRDALALNRRLNVAAWARMNDLNVQTITGYVYQGELTPEARNRLDRGDEKTPRRRKVVNVDVLRALRDALALDRGLNVAEWARANHLHPRTMKNYVFEGALTQEAQHRLERGGVKTPHRRKVGRDDLRALRDALALNKGLNVAAWARMNGLQPRTVQSYVFEGALLPRVENQLDLAGGKAPSHRKVGVDVLRALRDALALDRELNVAEWARERHYHSRTIENYVHNGALTPEAQSRLDPVDGKAPRLRNMETSDLRNLRDALALDSDLDVTAWAHANHLHARTVKNNVLEGKLTPEAQKRLDPRRAMEKRRVDVLQALSDALSLDPGLNVAEWARENDLHPRTIVHNVSNGALTPEAQNQLDVANGKPRRFRWVGADDLRNLDAALAVDRGLNVVKWAWAHGLNGHTIRAFVRNGKLTPEARKRLQNAGRQAVAT